MDTILTFAMLKENPVIGEVVLAIIKERERQDKKWGPPEDLPKDRTPADWFVILMEEVGELSKNIVEFNADPEPDWKMMIKDELIHTAASAISWLEWLAVQGQRKEE